MRSDQAIIDSAAPAVGAPNSRPRGVLLDAMLCGTCFYYVTSLIAMLGFLVGSTPLSAEGSSGLLSGIDAGFYHGIATRGYTRLPTYISHDDGSSVAAMWNIAFFPAYPVTARYVSRMTGLTLEFALLLVTHACLWAAFVTMALYLRIARRDMRGSDAGYALLTLGLLPTTFFFRGAYSESMFILLVAVALYGFQQHLPALAIALVTGLATATRPVGVALLVPLTVYLWRREAAQRPIGVTAFLRVGLLTAVGCWGLLSFMGFQWSTIGNPFAFAQAQTECNLRGGPLAPASRRVLAEVTLEPIWAVYTPSRRDWWANFDTHVSPLFSLQFANPIYFVGTVALIVIGWRKRWLNEYELLLSAGLLVIPYVTKSYDNAMASFGRFSAVVLPAYIVMGHLLARLPRALAVAILCVSALLLAGYSALFAAGYHLI